MPIVCWFYGQPSTGKTKAVYDFAEWNKLSIWQSSADLSWFDGYKGQDVALLDDFRPEMVRDFAFLLRLLD